MWRVLAVAASGLLLAAAAPVKLPGIYVLTGVREAAGELQLEADGRFRWAFTMGALDETAEGRWRLEGDRVLLTTEPAPRPPAFTEVLREAGDPKTFALILEDLQGRPVPNIAVEVRMADGTVERGQTRGEWLEAELDGRVPVGVRFEIPVFDVRSEELPLDLKAARRYRFRLDPGDLGVRAFRDWPLEIRGDLLAPPGAPEGQGLRRVATP